MYHMVQKILSFYEKRISSDFLKVQKLWSPFSQNLVRRR